MKHTDYRYVDLAIGGATKRNHVVDVNKLSIPKDAVDTYATMFRFKKEYQDHVESTGSVRGASQFACWSDFLWFDIDAADLQDATVDMQALLRGIESMGVLDHTVVFFSGSKGYHIGIDSRVFGFEPSQDLPEKMRFTCAHIASLFSIEIDMKIYNHNRLWRIPNTTHGKTKLRKTELSPTEAMELTIDEIKVLASESWDGSITCAGTYTDAKPVEAMIRLVRGANASTTKNTAGWDAPPISGERAKIVVAGLEELLSSGVSRGDRDNEALLRASECRKVGLDKDQCADRMAEWNSLNDPPLLEADLERVVLSAYTGKGYDFGTNHDSLREARGVAKRKRKDIDVDALLNGDVNEDCEKYERRPRTVTELLEGGSAPEMPELVGEYFSWRKRITLLVGREKYSGKSTICTFEAMAALRKGYRVLWVSPDEPRDDILYRLVKAGVQPYADNCVIASDMDVPSSWPELGKFIVDAKPDIIILDSIHSIFPIINEGKVPDSSESAEWQKLVAKLRPLAIALDAAVVWLHHANKATGLSAGSIGITAAVDAIVTMTTVRKPNRRLLGFLGRRVNSTYNCALDYIDEEKGYERVAEWKPSAENDNDQKSKSEESVEWLESFIANHDGDTFARSEAADAYRNHFNEDPNKGRIFKNALKELRERGAIGVGERTVGSGLTYNIINKGTSNDATKASDLTGGNDGEE